MNQEKFRNSLAPAASLLQPITAGATSCTVSNTANFPVLTGGDQFRMPIEDSVTSIIEIVIVTNTSGGTFTIVRGAEDSIAAAHAAGSICINGQTEEVFARVYPNGDIFDGTGNITQWPDPTLSILEIAKTAPAATSITIDPAALVPFKPYYVVDGNQDCLINPITLIPATGDFSGQPNFIMNINGMALPFYSNGTNLRTL